MSDDKPPVEAALDLLLYAPLGLALEARTLLPKLAERGRNQITMAKVMGQFAVQQGQVEAAKRLGPVQEQVRGQVGSILSDLGLGSRPAPPDPDRGAGPAPATASSTPVATASPPADEPRPVPAAPATPAGGAAELPIPDYDSLAASQVVPRLRALSVGELEAVRAYEAAGRGRKTILNRIAQLQSG